MATMPRLNRGQLTTMVRELTSIFSTDVFTNERIWSMLNQELFAAIKSADDLRLAWLTGSNVGPSTITVPSGTYRFPGWQFDNTAQFPALTSSTTTNMNAYLYLNTDTDKAPWGLPVAGNTAADIGGYYDKYLAYKVAAKVLTEVNDDTKRNEYFNAEADNIYEDLFRNEWLNHNMYLADVTKTQSTSIYFFQSMMVRVLNLLFSDKPKGTLDALLANANIIRDTLNNSLEELWNSYKWPFGKDWQNFAPYQDIFLYDAAQRLGPRFGLDEIIVKAYGTEYETRLKSLLRDKIYSVYGESFPFTLLSLRTQVRSLLQDFSKDLPEQLIVSWINEAYQTLSYERDWSWLETELMTTLTPGSNGIQFDIDGARRIISMYIVDSDSTNVYNSSNRVEQILPRPDILDGQKTSNRYYYDIKDGTVLITPSPEKAIKVRIKYINRTPGLLQDSDTIMFDAEFAPILAYRAAMKGLAFHDQGKKLYQIYDAAQQSIFNAMMASYQLDRSRDSFSIGQNAFEERRYMPYFRNSGS